MSRKGICEICGGETCRIKFKRCFNCYIKTKIKLSDEERKKYKSLWFQKNKNNIKIKRKVNPISTSKSRHYNFKSTYGISLEEYNKLLKEQNNKCLICGYEHKEDGKPNERLHVDHDHETKKIRGLICFKCNVALGHFNDDIKLLKNALYYMERFEDDKKISIDTENIKN